MSRKSPLLGGLLNLLIPGLAQGYVGNWGRAVLQFISSLVLLAALLFVSALLERTNPPWPEGLAVAVAILLYALTAVSGGIVAVRRHNKAHPAAKSMAGGQALVTVLSGGIVLICLLLVVSVWLGGLFDRENWEPLLATRFPELDGTRTAFQVFASSTEPPPTQVWIVVTSTPTGSTMAEVAASSEPPAATPEPEDPPTDATPLAVVNHETLNVRKGPGTGYDRLAVLRQGDQVTVVGRNTDGSWIKVVLQDGTEGWVYADYTDMNTPKNAIPVAQNIPPPLTAAEPTATLTVDEQIAKIAKGQHGTLPQPGSMGGVDAGGQAEVTIINDTPYVLTVLVGAPSSTSFRLEACATCKRYSFIGPISCPEEGRPRLTVRLQPGNSEVVARVNDPSVTPFYGRWDLQTNTAYFNCFYIVTR